MSMAIYIIFLVTGMLGFNVLMDVCWNEHGKYLRVSAQAAGRGELLEEHLFYSYNLLIVLAAISIVLMATAVLGFMLGRRAKQGEGDLSEIGAIQASVLGLLALMLGFTFATASARYDTRRELAVNEVNAISTTFLRAQTLPEPYRTNLSRQLRDYVDLRLQSASQLDNIGELVKTRRNTERLQQVMWRQAAEVAREYPTDITGLFEESMNESIDLYSSRVASYFARVPPTILWILTLMALASLGIVGYGFGLAGQRKWLIMALLSLIVAVVIVMIVDLDRPEAGPTRISYQGMVDLKNSMEGYVQQRR